jgi:hypothetical protein
MNRKNRKKYRIFMFLSARCSLLRAEGFSCSLGVLYGGLGISKLQFLIKKIKNLLSSCKFFSILGHQTLDPDPESGSAIRKNAGSGSVSGSAINQCGSATLRLKELDIALERVAEDDNKNDNNDDFERTPSFRSPDKSFEGGLSLVRVRKTSCCSDPGCFFFLPLRGSGMEKKYPDPG